MHDTVPCLALLAAALMLGGCFGPTDYQRSSVWNEGHGFEDQQVGPDEYSVVVRGNPRTSVERAAKIALLRAAHLCLENGHERFEVLDDETARRKQDFQQTVPVFSGSSGTIFVPVSSLTTREPVAVLLVRLVPDETPMSDTVLDARRLVAELEPELG